jgi:hypothetical protein
MEYRWGHQNVDGDMRLYYTIDSEERYNITVALSENKQSIVSLLYDDNGDTFSFTYNYTLDTLRYKGVSHRKDENLETAIRITQQVEKYETEPPYHDKLGELLILFSTTPTIEASHYL